MKDEQTIDKLLNRAESLAENIDRSREDPLRNGPLSGSPTSQYEILRKQIDNDVREFWFYISAQVAKVRDKTKKNSPEIADQLTNFLNVATQHKL